MPTNSVLRIRGLTQSAFTLLLILLAQACVASETPADPPNPFDDNPFEGKPNDEPERPIVKKQLLPKGSLSLGFTIARGSDGELQGRFYIRNREKGHVLLHDRMFFYIQFKVRAGTEEIQFHIAPSRFNRTVFYLVEPSPSGEVVCGCGTWSRRVDVPDLISRWLHRYRELSRQGVLPETLTPVSIAGRVEGSVLKWDPEAQDFATVPFDITSPPTPWKEVAPLFDAPATAEKEPLEVFEP